MEKKKIDIAVVGGGPAGLSAAMSASTAGAKVVLLEKEEAIAHSIRTSGVSWIDSMRDLGIPAELYNPVSNFRFISPSREVTVAGRSPKSCVLDVRSTYQFLATKAAEAGAEIMVRSNVIDILRKGDGGPVAGVRAKTPRGEMQIEATLVIDASGFSSVVGRRSNNAAEWTRYGVGAEYECYCESADPATWSVMVGEKYSGAGYAWVFPLSKSRVRIGVGIGRPESSAEPLEKLHRIIDNRDKPLGELGKIQPIELHYGFIPNQGTRESTSFDGLLLVGDSAGQSNPLVLEGIRYAIEFGRLAGRVGAGALAKGCSRDSLSEYERIWRNKVESKIRSALKVQSRWIGLGDSEWDREVEIIRDMTDEEFLDFIRADFTPSKMIKLAMRHPKLAARQLFNLVSKN